MISTATAAKSLQSCLTLYDPIDSCPPLPAKRDASQSSPPTKGSEHSPHLSKKDFWLKRRKS